jgi:hypothetical protein
MKRIEREEDERRGTVTYQLDDGRFVTLEANAVQQFGIDNLIQWLGIESPTERVPVMQNGRRLGTLPANFEPLNARRRNSEYEVRPGDFRREGGAWIVEKTLCSEDLDAVIGFERDA